MTPTKDTSTTSAERADFEAFMSDAFPKMRLYRQDASCGGRYRSDTVERMFCAWQAACASNSTQVVSDAEIESFVSDWRGGFIEAARRQLQGWLNRLGSAAATPASDAVLTSLIDLHGAARWETGVAEQAGDTEEAKEADKRAVSLRESILGRFGPAAAPAHGKSEAAFPATSTSSPTDAEIDALSRQHLRIKGDVTPSGFQMRVEGSVEFGRAVLACQPAAPVTAVVTNEQIDAHLPVLELDQFEVKAFRRGFRAALAAASPASVQGAPVAGDVPTSTEPVKGQCYNTVGWGRVTFVGLDHYCGETTYQLKTAYGARYVKPELWASTLAAPVAATQSREAIDTSQFSKPDTGPSSDGFPYG